MLLLHPPKQKQTNKTIKQSSSFKECAIWLFCLPLPHSPTCSHAALFINDLHLATDSCLLPGNFNTHTDNHPRPALPHPHPLRSSIFSSPSPAFHLKVTFYLVITKATSALNSWFPPSQSLTTASHRWGSPAQASHSNTSMLGPLIRRLNQLSPPLCPPAP